jgi:cyclic pyranopterin phosphate synthase
VTAARTAGIQAAKTTASLVPLCHPLSVFGIQVRISLVGDAVEVEAEASTIGPTGVEMEALTACAFASLTLVAALGATRGHTAIHGLRLLEKIGGRSGH